MIQRSPLVVFLLTLVTFGLYTFYWAYVTANELNDSGAEIPHPILSFVPLVNLWWLARYSGGVAKVTNGEWSALGTFAVLLLLPGIGSALVQSAFNRTGVSTVPVPA